MKTLNIGLVCVFGGFGVLANSLAAQALDFNFSFDADHGTPGTGTGVIQGLQDNNSNTNPNSIIISNNPIGIPFGTVFDIRNRGSFSVNNGQITGANSVYYFGQNYSYNIQFNSGGYNSIGNGINNTSSYNSNGFSGVTYTPATAVPWDFSPNEGVALGLPLFIGLRMLKKRRALKNSTREVQQMIHSRVNLS